MILPLIQVILTALLIGYAAFWRRQQTQRRAKSWQGIISQLRCNDWGIEEISESFLYKSEVQVTTGVIGAGFGIGIIAGGEFDLAIAMTGLFV